MNVRATLSHAALGSVVVLPDGWKETKLRLERHEDFHSLIEYMDVEFIFFGNDVTHNGGVDFVRSALLIGFDELVTITYEISFDDITYPLSFSGTLDLENSEEMVDNKIKVPVLRDDAWSKFMSRMETPVDIQTSSSLDNEPVNVFDQVNLSLLPQKLISVTYMVEFDGELLTNIPSDTCDPFECGYIQLTPNKIILQEVEESYNLPLAFNPSLPVWFIEADFDGVYDFDIRIEVSHLSPAVNLGGSSGDVMFGSFNQTTVFYFQLNEDVPIAMNASTVTYNDTSMYDDWPSPPVGTTDVRTAISQYTASLNLVSGDVVRVFSYKVGGPTPDIFVWGENGVPAYGNEGVQTGRPSGMVDRPTYFRVTSNTIFSITNCESFLLHDAAGQILDRITSNADIFYSDYLGSTQTIYRQYGADGCAWTYALAKGLQIRQYSLIEKPFFMSFKQWWEGANPILNLGLGYEEVNGQTVFRVEEKEHFYADETPVVNFSYVRAIVKTYDQTRIFNKLEVGYKKWESEDISGIDDPQTKKIYATRFQRSGQTLQIHSDFIAASLAIETTRRKTREKSADYKFDNDIFIIAIAPTPVDVSPETSPDVTDYEPELDENFDSVDNLNNPETRYNLRLTPARNLLRWLKYINGCMQSYLSSVYRFVSGEGNYDCETAMNVADCDANYGGNTLSEKGNISPTTEYLHLPDLYDIEIDMSYDEYLLIRNNHKKPIGISQTGENHIRFVIKDLSYSILESKAVISAWPKEPISLVVPEVELINECDTPYEPQLSAPASIMFSDVDFTSMTISWSAVSRADSYTLERALQSNFSDAEQIFIGSATSFNDSGLSDDTTYYYRVKADAVGFSESDYTTGQQTTLNSIGTSWQSATPAADNNWTRVAYGNGIFVAVAQTGSGNRVMTSTDGLTWTVRVSAADNTWRSVCFGGGLFVAVAISGASRVMTSPDGINWTLRTAATSNSWRDVIHGDGRFVAVSSDGVGNRVMYSDDGINWFSGASAEDNNWLGVAFGNGIFVAICFNGTNLCMTSDDGGETWTSRSVTANLWQDITFGGGVFVAVAAVGTGKIMHSSNGIDWTYVTSYDVPTLTDVAYGDGFYIVVASGPLFFGRSDNLTDWEDVAIPQTSNWKIGYGDGKFVAVGNNAVIVSN